MYVACVATHRHGGKKMTWSYLRKSRNNIKILTASFHNFQTYEKSEKKVSF